MKRETEKKRIIDHIVLNVSNMASFMYSQYFGTPESLPKREKPYTTKEAISHLEQHARKQLEADLIDLETLYDDIDGNDELIDDLPE